MSISDVEALLTGPLVAWFRSYVELPTETKLTYENLVNGVLMHRVFCKMDLYIEHNDVKEPEKDSEQRRSNLTAVVNNIRNYIEGELNYILLQVPNVSNLAEEPWSNAKEAKLLLQLLLGCAILCPNKKVLIEEMVKLDEPTLTELQQQINEIITTPAIMLRPEMFMAGSAEVSVDQCASNAERAFPHMLQIYRERNDYREKVNLSTTMESNLMSTEESDISILMSSLSLSSSTGCTNFKHQQLNAQVEKMMHMFKVELATYQEEYDKLKAEKDKLELALKKAKQYNDKVDELFEKAEKAERLEVEVQRYRNKLDDFETYKRRLNEVQNEKDILVDCQQALVEQIAALKSKSMRLEESGQDLRKWVRDLCAIYEATSGKNFKPNEQNAHLKAKMRPYRNKMLKKHFSTAKEKLSTHDKLPSKDMLSETLKLTMGQKDFSKIVKSLDESSLGNSDSKIRQLKAEKAKLLALIDSLKTENKELSRKNIELKEARETKTEQIEALEQQKSISNIEYCTLEEELEGLLENDQLNVSKESTSKKTTVELEIYVPEGEMRVTPRVVRKLQMNENPKIQGDATKFFEIKEAQCTNCAKIVEDLKKNIGEFKKKISMKDEHLYMLRREMRKLEHRLKVIEEKNNGLQCEKDDLAQYCSIIAGDKDQAVNQSLLDKETFQQKEEEYNEKLDSVNHLKEGLESKILDFYKNLANCPTKKRESLSKSFVKKTVSKIRRVSEHFNKIRKSSNGESSSPDKKTNDLQTSVVNNIPENIEEEDNIPEDSEISQPDFTTPATPNKSVSFACNFQPVESSTPNRLSELKKILKKSAGFPNIISFNSTTNYQN